MSSPQPEQVIKATDISFTYDGIPALSNVSFTIFAGDYVGVIGPNGGGKSTLIKILLGLLRPTTGDVTIFGVPIAKLADRHLIGYVPQHIAQSALEVPATVQEIVASGRTAQLGLWGRFGKLDTEAVAEAMGQADIFDLRSRRMTQLSGGERQRVFIARALAATPRILILDEPTVGVDRNSQEKFYEFLHVLNSQHGITILFVTHDIDVIAKEATTVLCLNHDLVCFGAAADLLHKDTLERLYGNTMKVVTHNHPH